MFKIIGNRARAVSLSKENLCPKCTYYHRRRNALDDQEVHFCTYFSRPVALTGPVAECTNFYDENAPKRSDFEKIAWVIETSQRKLGFAEQMDVKLVPPSKKEKKEHPLWD